MDISHDWFSRFSWKILPIFCCECGKYINRAVRVFCEAHVGNGVEKVSSQPIGLLPLMTMQTNESAEIHHSWAWGEGSGVGEVVQRYQRLYSG